MSDQQKDPSPARTSPRHKRRHSADAPKPNEEPVKQRKEDSAPGSLELERYWRNMPAKAVKTRDGSPVLYPRKQGLRPSKQKPIIPETRNAELTPTSAKARTTEPANRMDPSATPTPLITKTKPRNTSISAPTRMLASPPATPCDDGAETRPSKITIRIAVPPTQNLQTPPTTDLDTSSKHIGEGPLLPIPERFRPAYNTLDGCAERLTPSASGGTSAADLAAFFDVQAHLFRIAIDARNGWRDTALQLSIKSREATEHLKLQTEAEGQVKALALYRDVLEAKLATSEREAAAKVAAMQEESKKALGAKDKECSDTVRLFRSERHRLEDELKQTNGKVAAVEGRLKVAVATMTFLVEQARLTSLAHEQTIADMDDERKEIMARNDEARMHQQHLLDETAAAHRTLESTCRQREAELAGSKIELQVKTNDWQSRLDTTLSDVAALRSSKDRQNAELVVALATCHSMASEMNVVLQKLARGDAELATVRKDLNDSASSLADALAQEVENKAIIIRLRKELAEERDGLAAAKSEQLSAERLARESQDARQRAEEQVAETSAEKEKTIVQLRDRLSDEQVARRRADQAKDQAFRQLDAERQKTDQTLSKLRRREVQAAQIAFKNEEERRKARTELEALRAQLRAESGREEELEAELADARACISAAKEEDARYKAFTKAAEEDRRELEDVRAWLETMERDHATVHAERAELATLRDEHSRVLRSLADTKTARELAERATEKLRADADHAGKELDEIEAKLNEAAAARAAEEETWKAERLRLAQRRQRELELWADEELCGPPASSGAQERRTEEIEAELAALRRLVERYAAEDEKAGWNIVQVAIVEGYRRAVEAMEAEMADLAALAASEAERADARRGARADVRRISKKVAESEELHRLIGGVLWYAERTEDSGSDSAGSSPSR